MSWNLNDVIKYYLEKTTGYYGYYSDNKYINPFDDYYVGLNCYDEVCKGSHDRSMKIRELYDMKIKMGSDDFMDNLGMSIHELYDLHKEELIGLLNCSEHYANLWIDEHINFMHLKMHEIDDDEYVSIDPIIK